MAPHTEADGQQEWPQEYLRREDERLVSGHGRYLANVELDGLLECVFVRSSTAHGIVRDIDLSAALAGQGVIAAYTAAELPLIDIPAITSASTNVVNPAMSRPPLARDRVRYVGEPLAVVVADTTANAADAAETVLTDIEPLPAVVDARHATGDKTLLFPDAGTNLAANRSGHQRPEAAGAARDDWAVDIRLSLRHPRLAPAPIEPLGVIAAPQDDGGVTVWCGHQAPHRLRGQLARTLGLPPEKVRVIVPDVGGGFGQKVCFYPEYIVVAAMALRLGRPVRWLETRYESFIGGTHGRDQHHEIRLAGDADGRIHLFELDILANVGAYPHNGSVVPEFTYMMGSGPYDIHEVRMSSRTVVTNRAPTGVYRGAGRPEHSYSLERAIEEYARVAGLDPMDVRRRNFIAPDNFPYPNAGGLVYDSGNYAAALEKALTHLDMDAFRHEQRARAGGRKLLGVGAAAFIDRSGGAVPGLTEYASAEISPAGRLRIRAGSSSTGQGHATVFGRLATEVFGLPADDVDFIAGDTGEVPHGVGSFASRSGQMAGSAVRIASDLLREKILHFAAAELEVAVTDLDVADGLVGVKGDPAASLSLAEVATRMSERGEEPRVEETFAPNALAMPSGFYITVVEVDTETGWIDIVRLIGVDDCGNILNPVIVQGQVHGSTAQGIAAALFEEITYSDEGQPETATFADYTIPSAADLPSYITDHVITPSPTNPLGSRARGESGCLGVPPAIANAVHDALRPLGVRDLEIPFTPQRVWRAIHDARTAAPVDAPVVAAAATR